MLSCKNFSRLAFLLVVLSATACSNTPPAGEGSGNPDATPDSATSQSNADQVGSVPEDMLSDEKGVEGSASTADAATEVGATKADPFADLKEKEDSKDNATPVADEDNSAPSHNAAGSGKMEKYNVKAGDTLMKIAFNLYGDVDRWKDLHELNQAALKSGSALRKGMKLRYEVPVDAFQPEQLAHSYLIKKGDTLAGIADDVYGKKMKYKKLQSYNKNLIKNPNRIFAGFTIFYDITEKEMAEAEARKAQKAAAGGGAAPAPGNIPSAISPPPAPAPAPMATGPAPQATDNSAVQGPGAQQGPPAPTPQ